MRLPKTVFLKRKMQNSCTKAARRHRRNYRKNLGKTVVFEGFHSSEGLRKGRNGSRFSKQNSIQNPPKINPKLTPNRSTIEVGSQKRLNIDLGGQQIRFWNPR